MYIFDATILLLGIYLTNIFTQVKWHKHSIVIVNYWKQFKYPSIEWLNNLWYIHKMEYYSHSKE